MPSITSSAAVHFSPIGLMAITFQPASRNAPSSIHTRRSKGSGRFSERWRTLPGEPMVFPGRHRARIDRVDEIDEDLARAEPGSHFAIRLRAVRHHDDLAPVEHFVDRGLEALG